MTKAIEDPVGGGIDKQKCVGQEVGGRTRIMIFKEGSTKVVINQRIPSLADGGAPDRISGVREAKKYDMNLDAGVSDGGAASSSSMLIFFLILFDLLLPWDTSKGNIEAMEI